MFGARIHIEPSALDADVINGCRSPIPAATAQAETGSQPSPRPGLRPARNSSTPPGIGIRVGASSSDTRGAGLRGPAYWPPEVGPLLCSHAFTPAMTSSAQSRVRPIYSRRTRTALQTNVSRK
jgi:hypothetical protein